LYRKAAQAYCRAGDGVSEPLNDAEPYEINAGTDEKYRANHSRDCCRSEDACYDYYAEPTAFGGRIHQGGNQHLTRPENKNHKQCPGSNAYPALIIMNVSVLMVVTVLVRVP